MYTHIRIFGPRFQNWDPRIRPVGGNFTENQILRSQIVNAGVQRSEIRKVDPRMFDDSVFSFSIHFFGCRKASAENQWFIN